MALQRSAQQSEAVFNLVSTLQKILGDLLTGFIDTRETLKDIKAALDDAQLRHAASRPLTDGGPPLEHRACQIVVRPLGALGNRMIQHMVAMAIAAQVPGAVIPRVELPEWGMLRSDTADAPVPSIEIGGMRVDVRDASSRLRRGAANSVTVSGYVQHIRNFLDPDLYRSTFVSKEDVIGFGPEILLISLRMAEITTGVHPPYVLLPVEFYRDVIRDTGLKPVFFGQLTPSPYLDSLRHAFPRARFISGKGATHDFEIIRRSRNILISISTFSWLAAWLSEADQVIMPLAGLFHPVFGAVYGDGHNLVPVADTRYVLYLFPMSVAAKPEKLADYHRRIDQMWRKSTYEEIDDLLARHQSAERSLERHLDLFDEEFYLTRYPELSQAIKDGHIESGSHHYRLHGFCERRVPFRVDLDYLLRYPDAGFAIGRGEYFDMQHFHAEKGAVLGYLPFE